MLKNQKLRFLRDRDSPNEIPTNREGKRGTDRLCSADICSFSLLVAAADYKPSYHSFDLSKRPALSCGSNCLPSFALQDARPRLAFHRRAATNFSEVICWRRCCRNVATLDLSFHVGWELVSLGHPAKTRHTENKTIALNDLAFHTTVLGWIAQREFPPNNTS